ncbi:hypothetical protein DBR42_06005 [Pelomonas sp. HMWF004]|nr:hypothetical protein DBR42_06005 [Pelomonas sp. HMWF004]
MAAFMRFTAPDPLALQAGIVDKRNQLATALGTGDPLAIVDAAADLAGLLTTARQEADARALLEPHLERAQALSQHEQAAWFWNAYATALQYCGEHAQAEPHFATAVALAQAGGWGRIQAMALQHWGRSLAEQQRFAEAQDRITQALALRVAMDDPRQDLSRRALAELAVLQRASARPA